MGQFRVELTVELSAENAEDAVAMAVEMANGWSYVVTDFTANTKKFVHLFDGKKTQVEPYPDKTTRFTMEEAVRSVLPNASFEEDNDGQIVIYSNLTEIEDGIVQDIDELSEIYRSDPYNVYGTPEHEALLIAKERGERW
jgi:hypothetical protein